jgi:tetratricopeptide (TPR) repeat protein
LGTALWWLTKQTEAQTEARAALQEAKQWQKTEKWSAALSAVRRAQGALRVFGSDASLRQQVDELDKDLEMAQRLEEARLQSAAIKDGDFDIKASISAYQAAFVGYGLDLEHEDDLAVAEFIRTRSIAMQLVAALDYWASLERFSKDPKWKHLFAVARAADTDNWRNGLRMAWERRDDKTLNHLLASAEVDKLLPTTIPSILVFFHPEDKTVTVKRAAALLRRAQQRHPADFWINYDLAMLLHHAPLPQLEEAIGYYRAAVALRPQSPAVHNSFGFALAGKGQVDEAIAEYREAIRLKKDYALAHHNLGNMRFKKGQLDEAITEYREAIRLKKDYAEAHVNLGVALTVKGQLDEAIAEHHEAIRLKKDLAEAHHNLGNALTQKGQLDEAIAEYREAIRLKKDYAFAHSNLGAALHSKGRLDEAIAEYREAIRLKKDFAEAHHNLGNSLTQKGQFDEAIAEYHEAIRLKKDYAGAHCALGALLEKIGRFSEALAYRRRGHEIGSKNPRWRYPSAQWVRNCERLVELDDKLPAFLSGQKRHADSAECLALAQLCQMPYKRRYLAAKRFYSQAFAEKPSLADDLNSEHRYNAACAAALAGCGQGADTDKLDANERTRLRRQALDWLRADLRAYRQVMVKSAGKAGPGIAQRMQHWLQDGDFALMRGAQSLAKLPEAERKEWQKLWEEVEALRERASSRPQTTKSVRP